MQHTLLPLPDRIALRKEYRLRVLIVLFFTLSVAGIVGASALFPSFIRASTEEHAQLDTIASLRKGKDDSGATQIENDLSRDAALAAALSAEMPPLTFSEALRDIISARGPVRITSIAADIQEGALVVIIQGVAPTRDSLVSFKARLENLMAGNTVELPLSELAQSRNLTFSLKLTQKLP